MSKVFLFLYFCLVSFQITHARKPAVDPIVGISIEEYKEVAPEKAKGFNFSKSSSKVTRVHNTDNLAVGTATDTSGAESSLIIFLILLPIIATSMAFFLMKKDIKVEDNVYDLFADKSTSADSDDDHHDTNIPKAS